MAGYEIDHETPKARDDREREAREEVRRQAMERIAELRKEKA